MCQWLKREYKPNGISTKYRMLKCFIFFLLSISMKFKCRSHTCWAQKPIIKVANAREAQENESTVNSMESWNELKFPVKIIYIFVLSYFIAFANID